MRDFIERLKSKPEHVRRRIALGTSLGVTGVVAAVWAFGLIFSGSLSFTATSPGSNTGTLAQSSNGYGTSNTAAASNGFQQLLSAVGVGNKPAELTPIDASGNPSTSSTGDTGASSTTNQQTVIPF
jgi:hypothetical protein